MTEIPFGELFTFIRNGMNVKQDKSGSGLPITRIETISAGTIDPSRVGFADLGLEDGRNWLLHPGDILFSHINSVEHIGKCAIYKGSPEKLVHGMNLLCLRPKPTVLDSNFARWLLRSEGFRSRLSNFVNKAVNQASVSITNLRSIRVTVPPIEEQRRIAAILDQAEALRAKRRQALAKLDTLTQSLFLEMFREFLVATSCSVRPLSDIADIASGITKGRPLRGQETESVPYLRVANVQAGHIDLSDTKYIDATEEEIAKWRLVKDDILMTEGGDFDKLGRGAVWGGGIDPCIHQNHVFRVRLNLKHLLPDVFHYYLQTASVRRYFLKCAKKTSNLASINMTQLKALPVFGPPLSLQERFSEAVLKLETLRTTLQTGSGSAETLFASLQHRAFRGEL